MDIENVILWGFVATIVRTILLAVSKPLGISRIDIPFLLGTMLTANRNKAPFYGLLLHIVIGLVFAFLYAAILESLETRHWWYGMLGGGIHGAFVLSAGLNVLAAFHPRMAHPYQGPTPTRQLQPPGFFALNYGKGTPIMTMVAHIVYGGLLGLFY